MDLFTNCFPTRAPVPRGYRRDGWEGFGSQTSFVGGGKSEPEHPLARLRGNLFLL